MEAAAAAPVGVVGTEEASFALNEKYRVFNRVLGSGQAGVVRHGVDVASGEQVAIKVLDRTHTERDPKRRESLRREISVSMRLQHENIIRLLDVVVSGDRIHLVMEIARGGELFAAVQQRGAVPEDESRVYFAQLISAVQYCHSQQVCHRDLKLENVMLKEPGSLQIKITDFGFSKDFGNESLPKTKRIGTLAYMAPEVARDEGGTGEPYDGNKADIWACGVILYILATGRYPFGDEGREKASVVYARLLSGQYAELPPTVSAPCADLIGRILVPEPEQRPTIQAIQQHSWCTAQPPPEPAAPPPLGAPPLATEFQWPDVPFVGDAAEGAADERDSLRDSIGSFNSFGSFGEFMPGEGGPGSGSGSGPMSGGSGPMSGGSARSGFDAAGQPVSLLDAVTFLDSAAVGAAGGGASQEMAEPPLDGGAVGAMRDAFAADSELRASTGEAFALQMPGSRRPPEDRSGLG